MGRRLGEVCQDTVRTVRAFLRAMRRGRLAVVDITRKRKGMNDGDR
jgi:hypothetical protein